VIIPDVNLLIHAYNSDSTSHAPARRWWEDLLNGDALVGLSWVGMLGFIRISTSRHVLAHPFTTVESTSHVQTWLDRPFVTVVHPGDRHAEILFRLLAGLGTAGNLTTDAHLAALAIEHQAEVHSTDADFGRFPGLRWTNPLQ
jgi:toxin-antitoxin system PIN domain toxin